jgi:hypothetical protein
MRQLDEVPVGLLAEVEVRVDHELDRSAANPEVGRLTHGMYDVSVSG